MLVAAALLASLLILALQLWWLPAYWQDDAYISFAYGRNLVDHGRFVYRLDESVEGYTNFLWTLLSAAAYAIGGERHTLVIMQALAAVTAGAVLAILALRKASTALRVLAPLMMACTAAHAVHVLSGLETAAYTLATLIGCVSLAGEDPPSTRRLLLGQGAFLAVALLRFDGVVVLLLSSLCLVLGGRARGAGKWALIVPWSAYALYTLWRFIAFDALLPNTVLAKMGARYALSLKLVAGGEYLWRASVVLGLVALLPGLALYAWRRRRRLHTDVGLAVVGWHLSMSVVVGGDAMQGYRFVFPAVPVLLLLALRGYAELSTPVLRRGSLGVAAVGFVALVQWWLPVTAQARVERSATQHVSAVVAAYLASAVAFAPRCDGEDEVATDIAGVYGFFTRCRVLDTWGLTSREIARRGRPRHPGRYETYGVIAPEVVLERAPRFILPYPPIVDRRTKKREVVLDRIFPERFFTERDEMHRYVITRKPVPTGVLEYLELPPASSRPPVRAGGR